MYIIGKKEYLQKTDGETGWGKELLGEKVKGRFFF